MYLFRNQLKIWKAYIVFQNLFKWFSSKAVRLDALWHRPLTSAQTSESAGGPNSRTRKEEGKERAGREKVTGAVRAGNEWLARRPGAPRPVTL